MANVAHSALTGSNLHEPKGADTAAANTVYVFNGAGSGSAMQLPVAALSSSANSFGAALFHAREQQTFNNNGSSSITANTWSELILNTAVTAEIPTSSLAGNRIFLPIGTYYAEAVGCAGISPGSTAAVSNRLKLYDVTHGSDLVYGTVQRDVQIFGVASNLVPRLAGRFALSAAANVNLQMWTPASPTNGGWASNDGGTPEIYGQVWVWRIKETV